MDKKTTQELNELSLQTMGHKYAWKKLYNKGLMVNMGSQDKKDLRRVKMTLEQVKSYMLKALAIKNGISEGVENV